ncbi:MAG: helix-turn-helix domain-containing protein [Parafilimonas sp.]
MEKTIHEGRNVKRIREMLGIKQETLALELGDDWNQKKISLLEGKETIEPQLLDEVAKALKVPVEAIKNFDEQAAINIIANTVTNYDNASVFNYYPTFNPIDKIISLYDEKIALYERMLKDKDGMIEELRKLTSK